MTDDLRFIGREKELEKITKWLKGKKGGRFYSLSGPNDIGKTTLIKEVLKRNDIQASANLATLCTLNGKQSVVYYYSMDRAKSLEAVYLAIYKAIAFVQGATKKFADCDALITSQLTEYQQEGIPVYLFLDEFDIVSKYETTEKEDLQAKLLDWKEEGLNLLVASRMALGKLLGDNTFPKYFDSMVLSGFNNKEVMRYFLTCIESYLSEYDDALKNSLKKEIAYYCGRHPKALAALTQSIADDGITVSEDPSEAIKRVYFNSTMKRPEERLYELLEKEGYLTKYLECFLEAGLTDEKKLDFNELKDYGYVIQREEGEGSLAELYGNMDDRFVEYKGYEPLSPYCLDYIKAKREHAKNEVDTYKEGGKPGAGQQGGAPGGNGSSKGTNGGPIIFVNGDLIKEKIEKIFKEGSQNVEITAEPGSDVNVNIAQKEEVIQYKDSYDAAMNSEEMNQLKEELENAKKSRDEIEKERNEILEEIKRKEAELQKEKEASEAENEKLKKEKEESDADKEAYYEAYVEADEELTELKKRSKELEEKLKESQGELDNATQKYEDEVEKTLTEHLRDKNESLMKQFPMEERRDHILKNVTEERFKVLMKVLEEYGLKEKFEFATFVHYLFKVVMKICATTSEMAEIDYTPVTILYAKLYEHLLKREHSSMYIEKCGNEETDIKDNNSATKSYKKWQDLAPDDINRLTIGSFSFVINKTSNLRVLAGVVGNPSNDPVLPCWQKHQGWINDIKDWRNDSAHEVGSSASQSKLNSLISILLPNKNGDEDGALITVCNLKHMYEQRKIGDAIKKKSEEILEEIRNS